MSTVEEAGRCIKELNGVVSACIVYTDALLTLPAGVERPSHPCGLLGH